MTQAKCANASGTDSAHTMCSSSSGKFGRSADGATRTQSTPPQWHSAPNAVMRRSRIPPPSTSASWRSRTNGSSRWTYRQSWPTTASTLVASRLPVRVMTAATLRIWVGPARPRTRHHCPDTDNRRSQHPWTTVPTTNREGREPMPIGCRRTGGCEDSTDRVDSLIPRLARIQGVQQYPVADGGHAVTGASMRPAPARRGLARNSPIPPSVHRPCRGEPWSTGTVPRSAAGPQVHGEPLDEPQVRKDRDYPAPETAARR